MYKISTQAYQSLAMHAERDFKRRLTIALHQVFGASVARFNSAELDALANCAIQRADMYQLRMEYSIWAVFAAMYVYGPNFDQDNQHTWSRDVLGDEHINEDAVVALLGLRIYMDTGKVI